MSLKVVIARLPAVLAVVALLAPLSSAHGQSPQRTFNINSANVGGIGSGEVFITGGGTFDPVAGVVKAGGAFHCLQDISQGPLAGLKAGESMRWDAEDVVQSFDIRCRGTEALRTVVTDDHTVIMMADFYRRGDGNQASLHAIMFVSAADEGGGLCGAQTVWVQGVGCGVAVVRFN